jgi:methylmalonyl-CoA/ethylmalonyl-CoA epimerase
MVFICILGSRPDMEETPIKMHHGAVSVPNLDASIVWYEKMLGFEIEQRFRIPGQPVEFAMMKRGELRVELFEAENSKPMEASRREPNTAFLTQGSLHFAFAVPDVRALAESLRVRGADIVWVRDFEFGSNAFIRDNAGNLIEFVQQNNMG